MVDLLAGERASVKWGLVGGAVRTQLYLLQSEFRMSLVERSSSKYIQGLLNIPGRKRQENHLPLYHFSILLSLNYRVLQVLSHSWWSRH